MLPTKLIAGNFSISEMLPYLFSPLLSAFFVSFWLGASLHYFPLTLTLSPREREFVCNGVPLVGGGHV